MSTDLDADGPAVELVAATDLLGRKWHPVVVHRLARDGPLGFADLGAAIDDVSNKVLSETLDDLEDGSVVSREVVSQRPFRVEYALTDAGVALESVLSALLAWHREYGSDRR